MQLLLLGCWCCCCCNLILSCIIIVSRFDHLEYQISFRVKSETIIYCQIVLVELPSYTINLCSFTKATLAFQIPNIASIEHYWALHELPEYSTFVWFFLPSFNVNGTCQNCNLLTWTWASFSQPPHTKALWLYFMQYGAFVCSSSWQMTVLKLQRQTDCRGRAYSNLEHAWAWIFFNAISIIIHLWLKRVIGSGADAYRQMD